MSGGNRALLLRPAGDKLQPAVRQRFIAVRQAAFMQHKLAEASPVLERGVEAVRADVMFAGLIGVPDAIA